MISEKDVGARIRKLRSDLGMTLEELAEKADFTKGYLSRVENGKKAPPVATLIRLANALEVTLSDIFEEQKSQDFVSLVKRGERRAMARPGTVFGYYYETLTKDYANKAMHPYVMTKPLNVKKQALFRHEGEEMIFMLEGRMKYFVGDREFVLEEGDCLYFDTSHEHYGTAIGDKDVKALLIVYTPKETG